MTGLLMLFSRRGCNLLAAIGCFSIIAVAYFYFEKTLYLYPCPMCYAQRIAIGIVGFFFLIATIVPGGKTAGRIYGLWLFLLSAGGAALSIRHLYLQNLPKDQLPSCGQDFYGLLENTPMPNVIKTMLTGTGDCGEVQWVFLNLSIPGWTLVVFVGLGIWGFFHNAVRS
ncbi:MAG: disulfide bond formation protein B [Gammaproteobacteria bacterium]|nr:disulfide bond formation protein B [Gammaproteobacteria bacterium]